MQVTFDRNITVDGYGEAEISLTFVPFKLTTINQKLTLFLDN